MVGELAAIVAAYGIGIGLVHWMRWRSQLGRGNASHAVIVTRNVGLTIEWHLWTFAFLQWLKARHTKVTIVDEGSTDETVSIVERMVSRLQADWEIVTVSSEAETSLWLEQADEVFVLRSSPGDQLQAAVRA